MTTDQGLWAAYAGLVAKVFAAEVAVVPNWRDMPARERMGRIAGAVTRLSAAPADEIPRRAAELGAQVIMYAGTYGLDDPALNPSRETLAEVARWIDQLNGPPA